MVGLDQGAELLVAEFRLHVFAAEGDQSRQLRPLRNLGHLVRDLAHDLLLAPHAAEVSLRVVAETHVFQDLAAGQVLLARLQMDVQVAVVVVVVHRLLDVDVETAHGVDELLGAFGLDDHRRVDRRSRHLADHARRKLRAAYADDAVDLHVPVAGDRDPCVARDRDECRAVPVEVEVGQDERVRGSFICLVAEHEHVEAPLSAEGRGDVLLCLGVHGGHRERRDRVREPAREERENQDGEADSKAQRAREGTRAGHGTILRRQPASCSRSLRRALAPRRQRRRQRFRRRRSGSVARASPGGGAGRFAAALQSMQRLKNVLVLGLPALRRSTLLLAMLAAAFAPLTTRAHADETARAVSGEVRDAADGAPVAGAVITLEETDGSRISATSDQSGAFVLAAPPAGRYRLVVAARGYRTASVTLAFAADRPRAVGIVLSRDDGLHEIGGAVSRSSGRANPSSGQSVSQQSLASTGALRVADALHELGGVGVSGDSLAPGGDAYVSLRGLRPG